MATQAQIDNRLDELATIIINVGQALPPIEGLIDTYKWDQRAFLPKKPRIGTTVRVGQASDSQVAIYVHCQTTLIDSFRSRFPELTYEGNRAIVFDVNKKLPKAEISECVEAALLYHYNKRHTDKRKS